MSVNEINANKPVDQVAIDMAKLEAEKKIGDIRNADPKSDIEAAQEAHNDKLRATAVEINAAQQKQDIIDIVTKDSSSSSSSVNTLDLATPARTAADASRNQAKLSVAQTLQNIDGPRAGVGNGPGGVDGPGGADEPTVQPLKTERTDYSG